MWADHQKWLRDYHPEKDIPLYPSLPAEIDTWIKNIKFVIPNDYMSEIKRNAQRGLEEWNIQRGFDTNVREFCLKPAIWHIYTAFYLISDCAYDPKENYYYRGDDKPLIPHVLAYKFWAHQTGRGCVSEHANFDALKKTISFYELLGGPSQSAKNCKEFLETMKEHERNWDKGVNVFQIEEDKPEESQDPQD